MKRALMYSVVAGMLVLLSAYAFSSGPQYSKHNDDLYVTVNMDPPIINVLPGTGGIGNADLYIFNNTDDVTYELLSIRGELVYNDGSTSPVDFGPSSVDPDGALFLFTTLFVSGDAAGGGGRIEIDVEYAGDDGSYGVAHAKDGFTILRHSAVAN